MNETAEPKTTEKNKPAHKIRLGSLAVTIWENAFDEGKDHLPGATRQVVPGRPGPWQETFSFRAEDLVLVSLLARRAADWILAHEAE